MSNRASLTLPLPPPPVNWRRALAVLAGIALIAGATFAPVLALAQDATPPGLSGQILVDGSPTVAPLTQAIAHAFARRAPQVTVSVEESGAADGFERFCAGETDLQGASREITDEEAAACEQAGIGFLAVPVALDGLTVVVNENATFINCLNIPALKYTWQEENPAKTWADLNPAWPPETIAFYGPGEDGGALALFMKSVMGEGGVLRDDVLLSDDDDVIVEGVANEENALGVVGHAAWDDNQDTLNAVAVDLGAGCVEPGAAAILDGRYAPLTRPLYLYVNTDRLSRPEVAAFARFFVDQLPVIGPEAGYVPAPPTMLADAARGLTERGTAAPNGTPTP
jgi:phosphate transport system substrate-binding protein